MTCYLDANDPQRKLIGVGPLQSNRNRLKPSLALVACLLPLYLSGCAGRAYSDLYIENMAGEIRDLEDQLYEYDYQYRVLEQENADLQQQNQRLLAQQTDSQDRPAPAADLPDASDEIQMPNPALDEDGGPPRSILERPPTGNAAETISNMGYGQDNPFPASQGSLPTPPSELPRSPTAEPGGSSNDSFNLDPSLLEPPTIELGEPMPPSLPVTSAPGAGTPAGSGLNETLSRVRVPAQLAAQRTASEPKQPEIGFANPQAAENSRMGLATIKPARELTDRRIVEIAFHPSLSRSANFDDEPDDDGLYLVLQPMNQKGEVVPLEADLSVAVIDPARAQENSVIARWDYSASDVSSKIKPIGSEQGIHLRLPWNGPDPIADRVEVFARYTFSDGRQVVGIKTIFVSTEASQRTVWAPRGGSGSRTVVASHEQNTDSQPSVSPASFSEESPQTEVVRPPAGTTEPEPPPVPRGYVEPLRGP